MKQSSRLERRRNRLKGIAAQIEDKTLSNRRVLRDDELADYVNAMDRNDTSRFSLARMAAVDVDMAYRMPQGVYKTLLELAGERMAIEVAFKLVQAGANPSRRSCVPINDGQRSVCVPGCQEVLVQHFHPMHIRFILSCVFQHRARLTGIGTSPVLQDTIDDGIIPSSTNNVFTACEKCGSIEHHRDHSSSSTSLSLEGCGHDICEVCIWTHIVTSSSSSSSLLPFSTTDRGASVALAGLQCPLCYTPLVEELRDCPSYLLPSKPMMAGLGALPSASFDKTEAIASFLASSELGGKGEHTELPSQDDSILHWNDLPTDEANRRRGRLCRSTTTVDSTQKGAPFPRPCPQPDAHDHALAAAAAAAAADSGSPSHALATQRQMERGQRLRRSKQRRRGLSRRCIAAASVGVTREQRLSYLFAAAEMGDFLKTAALCSAHVGVEIEARDKYGLTPLHVSAARGHWRVVLVLLRAGADVDAKDMIGATATVIATMLHDKRTASILREFSTARTSVEDDHSSMLHQLIAPIPSSLCPDIKTEVIIDPSMEHPGAGAFTIDNAFPSDFLQRLLTLEQTIPTAINEKKSSNARTYYRDVLMLVRSVFRRALTDVVSCYTNRYYLGTMAFMRFLRYEQGQGLPPHVDLSRYDSPDGTAASDTSPLPDCVPPLFSTHTFILYLSDMAPGCGGETLLLKSGRGRGKSVSNASVNNGHDSGDGDAEFEAISGPTDLEKGADDEAEPLATVHPQYGRLFVFPHACPHLARPTLASPREKVLLRGEMCLPLKHRAQELEQEHI